MSKPLTVPLCAVCQKPLPIPGQRIEVFRSLNDEDFDFHIVCWDCAATLGRKSK